MLLSAQTVLHMFAHWLHCRCSNGWTRIANRDTQLSSSPSWLECGGRFANVWSSRAEHADMFASAKCAVQVSNCFQGKCAWRKEVQQGNAHACRLHAGCRLQIATCRPARHVHCALNQDGGLDCAPHVFVVQSDGVAACMGHDCSYMQVAGVIACRWCHTPLVRMSTTSWLGSNRIASTCTHAHIHMSGCDGCLTQDNDAMPMDRIHFPFWRKA